MSLNKSRSFPYSKRYFSTLTAGFSLVELLVVVAIIGILSAIAVPAVSSLNNAAGMNRAVSGISLLLDQARVYAMAHNTYVWVGFSPDTTSQQIVVGVVSGITGNADDLAAGDIVPVTKLQTYDHVGLQSISGLEGMSSSEQDISNSKIGTFQQKTGQTSVKFTNVLQFSLDGEALIDKTPGNSHWIQIGLQPIHGSRTNDPNVAVFQVAALTGQVQVFRRP